MSSFPYWPATVIRVGLKGPKYCFRVQFPNKQYGEVDEDKVMPFSKENLLKVAKQKFKKSGYETSANFAADVKLVTEGT